MMPLLSRTIQAAGESATVQFLIGALVQMLGGLGNAFQP